MTKTELVAAMAENAELTKKDSDKVLNAFISIVTNELKKGNKVALPGFGTFETSETVSSQAIASLPAGAAISLRSVGDITLTAPSADQQMASLTLLRLT